MIVTRTSERQRPVSQPVGDPRFAYRFLVTEHTGETRNQQLTRNVGELLQELRVAQAGVQILFGFLLSVVFTERFHNASGFEKSLHLAAVMLSVAATALLTAPASWHRLLFRTGSRERILTVGNRFVLVGLVCLALAIISTVALIAKVVYGDIAMVVVAVLSAVLFGVLWFAIPLRLHPGNGDQPTGPPK
jgi:hypothetical protein